MPAYASTVGDVLPPHLEQTHALANLAITQGRRALGLFILSGFKHDADRKDFETMSGGDGCTLLNLLYARAAELNPAEINNITTSMSNLLATGLHDDTVAELSRFRSEYEKKNASLPTGERLDDMGLITKYRLLFDKRQLTQ